MKETPKRARTVCSDVVFGKENDRSAPAWIGEGDGVPAKERDVTFEEMVIFVGLEVETDL